MCHHDLSLCPISQTCESQFDLNSVNGGNYQETVMLKEHFDISLIFLCVVPHTYVPPLSVFMPSLADGFLVLEQNFLFVCFFVCLFFVKKNVKQFDIRIFKGIIIEALIVFVCSSNLFILPLRSMAAQRTGQRL